MSTADYVLGVTQSLVAATLITLCRIMYRRLRASTVTYSRIRAMILIGIPIVTMSLLLWFFSVTFIFPQHYVNPIALGIYHWAFPTSVALALLLLVLISVLDSVDRRRLRRDRIVDNSG